MTLTAQELDRTTAYFEKYVSRAEGFSGGPEVRGVLRPLQVLWLLLQEAPCLQGVPRLGSPMPLLPCPAAGRLL